MVAPAVGSVVLVRFPFSDLSASKVRPAVVIASAEQGNWILCQVTSNPYADAHAIEIRDEHLIEGSLKRVSYARPGKLFTASPSLMTAEVGRLSAAAFQEMRTAVISLIEGPPDADACTAQEDAPECPE